MSLSSLRKLAKRYSGPTVLARHATNSDPFGPSPQELHELTALSRRPKLMAEVQTVLEDRLTCSPRHWRHKSKALAVIHHLLLHGSDSCVAWVRSRIDIIHQLSNFTYSNGKNVDQGKSVREKAAAIIELANDPAKLEEEREKYQRARHEVRTSTGRGTSSRHTLELVRSEDSAAPPPVEPIMSPAPDKRRFSLSLALDSIEEEAS